MGGIEQLESRQLLTGYYIDPMVGSDSNPGTLESPFRTAQNLTAWADTAENGSFRRLAAGDTVYLREGVHDWSSLLASTSGREEGVWLLRDIHGTESAPVTIQAYPGEHPIVKAGLAGAENAAIYVLQSSHVKILGLEVTGTYGPGIRVAEATDVEIANNYVHDVDGNHDNNIAGIYAGSVVGLRIHHNLLHDNYDHARAQMPGVMQRANSRNIVVFGDGSDRVEVDHNKVFNTPLSSGQETGAGIWIKHASEIPGAQFDIHDNIVRDVYFSAIGSQSSNVHMHHNLVVNGAPFTTSGGDNVTTLRDFVLDHNTWVGGQAFGVHGLPDTLPTSGFLEFRNNIVVDNEPLYSVDGGIIRLAPYGSDAEYRTLVTSRNLVFDQNVYFNPLTSPRWNVFSANGGEYGVLGADLDFAGWRGLGVDRHSVLADPQFDASFIPANPAATSAGWWASAQPRLTMYVPQDSFRESAGANASSVTIVRAGMNLSQPLTVTLSTSDTTEVQLPASVTFPAGVAVVRVPIAAIDDRGQEPTRAVQLFAATTDLQASEWVRVLQDSDPPPANGVSYAYYEGNWEQLPDFDQLTPVKRGTSSAFTLTAMNRDYQFGFRFQTTLTVPTTGDYTFYLGSDDGSRLKIGNTVVVDNDGLHPYAEQQGTIHLDAGRHPLTVEFFESGGEELLTVDYAGPGFTRQPVPAVVLSQQTPSAPAGVVEFDVASRTVNENDGTVTLTVTRHDGSAGEIDVAYTTRNGTAAAGQDFAGQSGHLQFAYGQTSKTITLGLLTDTRAESEEAFAVDLTGVAGGATLGARRAATIVIRDVQPNLPPVVKTAPRARLGRDGKTAALSVLGGDDGGENNLTYTWAVMAKPSGAPEPLFGAGNGTHAGRKLSATFGSAGSYTLSVSITDADGQTTCRSVTVAVPPLAAAIRVTPLAATVRTGSGLQLSAETLDQFGNVLSTPGRLSWRTTAGQITNTGYFTAPNRAKVVTVTVKSGSLRAQATVNVSPLPVAGLVM